jgi:hypothetical protein
LDKNEPIKVLKEYGRFKDNNNEEVVVAKKLMGGKEKIDIRKFVSIPYQEGGYTGWSRTGIAINLSDLENLKKLINSVEQEAKIL